MATCCYRYLGLWRAVAGETLGVLFINFTLGALAGQLPTTKAPDVFLYSVFYTCINVTMTLTLCHVSGGHLNPAITAAMVVTRRINIGRAALYVVGQCSGAVIGSGLIYAITRDRNVGLTLVNEKLDISQAFGMETMATFVYSFAYFAAMDKSRRLQISSEGSPSILLVGSFMSGTIATRPFTGGSLNPSRSLGPAVVQNYWDKHWIFWLGPLVGGTVGGFVYDLIFAGNAMPRRALSFITDIDYKPDYISPKDKGRSKISLNNLAQPHTRQTLSSRSSNDLVERGVRKFKTTRDQRSRSPSHIGQEDNVVNCEQRWN